MVSLSLIIPCYNEGDNIDTLINNCSNFLKDKNNELILVNNGSKDNTESEISKYLNIPNIKTVNIENNKGFGYGIIKGLEKASGSILSYTHADNQTDPNDVLNGIKLIDDKYSEFFIKGNRIELRKNNWKYTEIIMTYSMSIFESILFQKILYDIHAQPVIFHKSFFLKWKNPPYGFLIDLYVYYYAKIYKLRIKSNVYIVMCGKRI